MPRTITIDNLKLIQVRLDKDSDRRFHVYVEYQLRVGDELVQGTYEEITGRLSDQLRAAALSLFEGIAQDLSSELA